MFPMAIKYINIFQFKALQNLPKLGFLDENKPSGNPDSIPDIDPTRPDPEGHRT
jgi:hypothetical protein